MDVNREFENLIETLQTVCQVLSVIDIEPILSQIKTFLMAALNEADPKILSDEIKKGFRELGADLQQNVGTILAGTTTPSQTQPSSELGEIRKLMCQALSGTNMEPVLRKIKVVLIAKLNNVDPKLVSNNIKQKLREWGNKRPRSTSTSQQPNAKKPRLDRSKPGAP